MKNPYIQPSIKEVKVNTTTLLAGSEFNTSNATPDEWAAKEISFDFFEEEEETPGKSDDDDWEDWEDEDDP